MGNLPFEYEFLAFRTTWLLLVLIRVYPRESVADFSSCTNLPWRDLGQQQHKVILCNVPDQVFVSSNDCVGEVPFS